MGSARCCWQSESMHLLRRFGQGELGLNRIEGFSDRVFAIIVTLLVLEVKVPILHDRSSTSELGNRLVDLGPKFLSWLISFIKPGMISAQVPHLMQKSLVGVISYLFGVAAGWFDVHAAFVLYALTPLFFITPPQGRRGLEK